MKRFLSIALATVMILSLCAFTAVAEGEAPFTCWLVGTDAQDASVFQALMDVCDATGIHPEFTLISPASMEERINLMWASPADMPDVIMGGSFISRADLETYASYGMIAPLNDAIEGMENMNKYMAEDDWKLITSADGNIYYFPTMVNNYINAGFYINQDWLTKLGLEMPNTLDEFYDVLVAFRDKDPNGNGKQDEIPFAIEPNPMDSWPGSIPAFVGAFGRPAGFQVENGKVIYANVMDEFKEGVKYLRKLYTEGLMDTELFTQDLTGFRAKAQNDELLYGSIMCFVASAANRCLTNEVWKSGDYVWLLPLENQNGVRTYAGPQSTTANINLVVTTNCKNIEAVAKWVDYMYDPAVSMTLDQAPVGIAWTIDETTGEWSSKSEAPEGYDSVAAWRMANHFQQVPRMLTRYAKEVAGLKVYVDPYSTSYDYSERDAYYKANGVVVAENLPSVAPLPEENEILTLYRADIDKLWSETVANWISGNGDVDAEWDAYVANMNALHLDEVLAVYQAQYDRANGK